MSRPPAPIRRGSILRCSSVADIHPRPTNNAGLGLFQPELYNIRPALISSIKAIPPRFGKDFWQPV
jgi:hypothetical protein